MSFFEAGALSGLSYGSVFGVWRSQGSNLSLFVFVSDPRKGFEVKNSLRLLLPKKSAGPPAAPPYSLFKRLGFPSPLTYLLRFP